MNSSIFRSYDIRGIYGKDLNEEIMKKIGKAFGTYIKNNAAVAMDCRLSSEKLKKAFISGLLETRKNVHDIGLLPLGAALFYAWQGNLELAYITASHLPKEWNGVKFFHSSGMGFLEKENFKVRDIFLDGKFIRVKTSGKVFSINNSKILENYKKYLTSKIKPEREKIKIVIDCGNGCAGLIISSLFEHFDISVIFSEPDGNFPNRSPDPHDDELKKLKEEIKNKSANMGIAYDCDGDRISILDDICRKLTPEQISYFILSELLKKEKGSIIANVECTRLIDDIAKKFGCKVIRVPVGHTFLMEAVHREKSVFGVEVSGHYALPSLIPFDDALAISYYASCVLSRLDKKLSEIVDEIPSYPFERINFNCSDDKKFLIVEKLKKKFLKEYKNVSTLDGVRIDFDNGWVLIRASNTSPKIRLTVEAKSQKEFKKLKDEFSKILEEEISF